MLCGYNTWSMPTVDIDTTVKHLARLGFDSMEMTICPGWRTDAAFVGPVERKRIKKLIRDHGIVLTGCSGNTPMLVDADTWAINRRTLEGYLDFVADMQEPGRRLYMSTTSGLPAGGDPVTAWEGCKNRLVDRFGELAAYAAKRGVTQHLEPHVMTAVRRAEDVLWLLGQVHSDALRISLDISHFEVQGIDYHAVVRALAKVTGGVEVKDEVGIYPNFDWLIPGEGEMDYAGFLRALADAGYDGGVAVEISKLRQVKPGYDPLTAAEQSYRVMAAGFAKAGVKRGR
jgi:sugar phosphate isomerase/epimerase